MVDQRVVSVPQQDRGGIAIAVGIIVFWWILAAFAPVMAQEADRANLREPVFRVAANPEAAESTEGTEATAKGPRAGSSDPGDRPVTPVSIGKNAPHPLDESIKIAREALDRIEKQIEDYTCTMVKRERVGGELLDHEFMTCKIRHARNGTGQQVPFSVYLGFRKPDHIRGREVIYVDGENAGKLIAHEGGIKGRFLPTVHLLPTSALAMRGNRYPITEIGIMTLTRRLIEKGERDRKLGICKVRVIEGAKVAGRLCKMLEVMHTDPKPEYDFHLARVFLDKQIGVPIRYESYGWPVAGGKPPLLEEYTYMDLKLNVGLSDEDFMPDNPKYRFK